MVKIKINESADQSARDDFRIYLHELVNTCEESP